MKCITAILVFSFVGLALAIPKHGSLDSSHLRNKRTLGVDENMKKELEVKTKSGTSIKLSKSISYNDGGAITYLPQVLDSIGINKNRILQGLHNKGKYTNAPAAGTPAIPAPQIDVSHEINVDKNQPAIASGQVSITSPVVVDPAPQANVVHKEPVIVPVAVVNPGFVAVQPAASPVTTGTHAIGHSLIAKKVEIIKNILSKHQNNGHNIGHHHHGVLANHHNHATIVKPAVIPVPAPIVAPTRVIVTAPIVLLPGHRNPHIHHGDLHQLYGNVKAKLQANSARIHDLLVYKKSLLMQNASLKIMALTASKKIGPPCCPSGPCCPDRVTKK